MRLVLSDDEAARIRAAAEAQGVPVAVWVRMVALQAARVAGAVDQG